MLRKLLVLVLTYLVITVLNGQDLKSLSIPVVAALVLLYVELRTLRKELTSEEKRSLFDDYF